MNNRIIILIVIHAALFIGIFSCDEDKIDREISQGENLITGRLSGTWANPSNILTPVSVPSGVFGDMRLTITTDDTGNPDMFLASNSPIIFSNNSSDWDISSVKDVETFQMILGSIEPVDELQVNILTSKILRITFYMGWENTETGEKGEGEFGVTLQRQ